MDQVIWRTFWKGSESRVQRWGRKCGKDSLTSPLDMRQAREADVGTCPVVGGVNIFCRSKADGNLAAQSSQIHTSGPRLSGKRPREGPAWYGSQARRFEVEYKGEAWDLLSLLHTQSKSG